MTESARRFGPAPDHPSRRRGKRRRRSACYTTIFTGRLLESCPEGRVLDIGGGTAHIKEFRPDVVSVDILAFPGIDVVADAHRLPFPDGFFAGVVMLDVLHHLERPIEFLKEASRVLKPGGRLVMIEPAMTTLARRFYDHFHEEPVDMNADPFAPVTINPNRDPFDANQAIPTLLFATAPARSACRTDDSIVARPQRGLAEPVCLSNERRIAEMVVDSSGAGRPDAGSLKNGTAASPKASGVPHDRRAGANIGCSICLRLVQVAIEPAIRPPSTAGCSSLQD